MLLGVEDEAMEKALHRDTILLRSIENKYLFRGVFSLCEKTVKISEDNCFMSRA